MGERMGRIGRIRTDFFLIFLNPNAFTDMKKIIFVMLLLTILTSAFSWAHTAEGTILGIVVDSKTEEPVVGAVVYLKNTNISAFTDTAGRFQLPIAWHDTLVKVLVHHLAYDDAIWNFKPNDLQVIHLNPKQNLLESVIIRTQYTWVKTMTIPVFIPDEKLVAFYQASEQADQAKQDSITARKLKGWRFWKKIVE
jgi:CarboxypepD_reg-like domain